MAVLAKVLRDEPPRRGERITGLPNALDSLVTRMLAKNRDERPADGAAVLSALDNIASPPAVISQGAPPPPTMTGAEQRLASVIVVDARRTEAGSHATLTPEESRSGLTAVEAIARRFGAEATPMASGTLLVTPRNAAGHADDVARVAACALALHRALPESTISLATGRAQTSGRMPLGVAIDRAVKLITAAEDSAPSGVLLDELTRSLVGERFEVRGDASAWLLISEKIEEDAPPPVLGKVLPCVGRDVELATLRATLADCVQGPTARAVLITGPPGCGKTRLWREFVREARNDEGLRILIARASPVGAGSSLALMRELVRSAVQVRRADPADAQRTELDAHVADLFAAADRARASDFLGELLTLPSRDAPTPPMRAARNDPQLMSDWTRRTLDEWLGAFVAQHATLIVLEDLHWGDSSTVTQLSTALSEHPELPLLVLALARPEVHEMFPALWPGHQEIRLRGLTRKAATALVRAALGDQIDPVAVERLIGKADGNPFFLEELVRAAAAGSIERIPETVLAVVESRLLRLEPDARRVLRAASVFGEVAWDGGVRTLLGARHSETVSSWLDVLVDREVLVRKPAGRFAGEAEFAFRHALWRESAYATLTDEDRRAAHALAGDWLEKTGERDGLVLAEHFELGGCGPRAATWLAQAATEALAGLSLTSALDLTQRGTRLTEPNELRGRLLYLRGSALNWLGRPAEGLAARSAALELLQPGTETWFASLAGLSWAAAQMEDAETLETCIGVAERTEFQPVATGVWGFGAYLFVITLADVQRQADAERISHRVYGSVAAPPVETHARREDDDPVFHAWRYLAESYTAGPQDDLATAVRAGRAAIAQFDLAGHRLGVGLSKSFLAASLILAGAYGVVEDLCEMIPVTTSIIDAQNRVCKALLHVRTGRLREARALLAGAKWPALVSLSIYRQWIVAAVLHQEGAFAEAARCAIETRESARSVAVLIPRCDAIIAAVLGRQGNHAEALAVAIRGLHVAQSGAHSDARTQLALTRAESLHALGRFDEARDAIRSARDRILKIATDFEREAMPDLRESWLGNVSENVRTLELARAWLGESD
jgi:hypothetical protein